MPLGKRNRAPEINIFCGRQIEIVGSPGLDYYNHVFIPGFATSFPLPAGELKLASNSRYESAELRARAGALFQLEPSPERLNSAQLQPAAQGQIKFSQGCGLQLPHHSADRGSGHREQLVGHEL